MGEPIAAEDTQRLEDTCTRCGRKMKIIAFLTDQLSIRGILDHLGLSTPSQDKPPPVREILRVAEQGEGWGVPAHWE